MTPKKSLKTTLYNWELFNENIIIKSVHQLVTEQFTICRWAEIQGAALDMLIFKEKRAMV